MTVAVNCVGAKKKERKKGGGGEERKKEEKTSGIESCRVTVTCHGRCVAGGRGAEGAGQKALFFFLFLPLPPEKGGV